MHLPSAAVWPAPCFPTLVFWCFRPLTHVTLVGSGGVCRHPGYGVMLHPDVMVAGILSLFVPAPGESMRELRSEQGLLGCSALSAFKHHTIAWEGEACCIFGAAYCVSSYLCASKLGTSQGPPCLKKYWRVPSAGAGAVTAWGPSPVCSPCCVGWGCGILMVQVGLSSAHRAQCWRAHPDTLT